MEALIAAREARRRGPLERLAERLAQAGLLRPGWTKERVNEVLFAITQFQTFDAFSQPESTMLLLCNAFLSQSGSTGK